MCIILFNILTSGAMSKIWGMINNMQLTSHLPIIQISMPTYTNATVVELLEIS